MLDSILMIRVIDYGLDNGDRHTEYEIKHAVKQELLRFLDEPDESPRRQRDGVYASYTWEFPTSRTNDVSDTQLVKVILLDARWFRDAPNEPIEQRDVLGNEQWLWFEKELRDSAHRNVAFTFVGFGTQVRREPSNQSIHGDTGSSHATMLID